MEFQHFIFVSLCYWASCALKLQDCPLFELLAAWARQSHPWRRLRRLRFHQVPILPWDILMNFDEQQMSALLATADFGLREDVIVFVTEELLKEEFWDSMAPCAGQGAEDPLNARRAGAE